MLKKINFLKIPSLIYFGVMCIGMLLGAFVLESIPGELIDLQSQSITNFISIFLTNGFAILLIYISCIFTNKYAYFTYGLNGLLHGITFGIVLKNYPLLFLLVIPHGIFEIPCILASGYIVSKGEMFIRNNVKRFFKILLIHELCILFCAFLEAFITPYFQKFI